MADLLAARTTVRVFNRAPKSDNRPSSKLRPLTNLVGNFLWCLRTRNANLYVGLSGGRGQWLDLVYVLSAKVCGHRIFVHHHSFAYINAPSFVNRLLFSVVRHETHVVLSRRMGDELIRLYQLEPAKVRVVSNAAFFAPVEANLRIPEVESPVRVGFLSAVSFEKGIGEFFSVMAELKRAGIPYVGRVAGPVNPAMRPQLETLLGSSSDVTYLGPVYDEAKAAFYRDLDVLLFPTDYANEAEPLVIHEAMRSGVHVIACDRGAIPEMLTPGAGVVCAKSSFVATASAQIGAFSADVSALLQARKLSLLQARRLRDLSRVELDALVEQIAGAPDGGREAAKPVVRGWAAAVVLGAACVLGLCDKASADVANHDTLEKATLPLDETLAQGGNTLSFLVGGQMAYDNNLFRLPSEADVFAVVGPGASRGDHIGTGSVGMDGLWTLGRQIITVDLHVDDNRYVRNDDLNNVSSNDSLKWNWVVGSALSGQLGVNYIRVLGGFYNTNNYQKNMVDVVETFGSLRYAMGPHIAVFGGVMSTDVSMGQDALKINDNRRNAVDVGMEYATGASSTLNLDYRHTRADYSQNGLVNGVEFDQDYRDDTVRLTFRDALTEKTQLEALVGYLKRSYPNTVIGAFSGQIWRLSLDWHPTDKTEILFAGSRDLQADLSAQTDYYVSRAFSISPTWTPTEKISLSLVLLHDQLDYIGVNEFVASVGSRRDKINSGQANVVYSPFIFSQTRALSFTFSYRIEHRDSNQVGLSYDDTIGKVGFNFKF
jgi:exopolysaccharide biosynthesis operon protein EpsL